jgi:membrane protein required for colicin V production
MNHVDLGVLVILAISALLGLSRGLVREMLGLGSWLLAGYGSFQIAPRFFPMVRQLTGLDPDVADPAALVVAFIILLIALSLIANVVGRLVRISALGGLDRVLGLLFGVARGAVILIAAYIPVSILLPPEKWPEVATQARTIPWIYQGAVRLTAALPAEYRDRLRVVPPPNGQPATPNSAPHATPDSPTHATPEPNVVGPPPPPPTSPI